MINIQSIERPWHEVAQELTTNLNDWKGRSIALSQLSKVNHQAIRRMLRGNIRNKTDNALLLCDHFKISITKSDKVIISEESKVISTFREIWDGTSGHAELIVKLIESTRSFTIKSSEK